ncbi:MAG: apolipoprotein N-acyltransferase [Pedosphaera sp.]|nr:apolipoprotein N-acyltransferase [Pedosphaera sp.]
MLESLHFSANLARLNLLTGQPSTRSRLVIAVVAGLSLAAAFPNIGIAGFAWIAPALMLTGANGTHGRAAFRIGYIAGLAFHLTALWWLLLIPGSGFQIIGWIALSAYLALYQAAWVWMTSVQSPESRVQSWLARTGWALLGAAAWVTLEMIQARLLSGFPWNFVGASQFKLIPLIQIASVTGVYGVSFVVVWASLSLFAAVRALLEKPTARYAWLGEIILPLFAVLGLCAFGVRQVRPNGDDVRPTFRVTFVQPSIPQTVIWNEAENDRRFNQLLELTRRALTNETDLLLWPEAAVPEKIRYNEDMLDPITALARSNKLWFIVGSDDAEPVRNSRDTNAADYFNASFLISPDGELVSRYCKRQLVMFGEYIPLVRWLPFLKWFVPGSADSVGFTPGDRVTPFVLERRAPSRPDSSDNSQRAEAVLGAPIHTTTLICFEDVFPHHVRDYMSDDTDFLVNLTNDGWFGEGGEQWQHAASAVFRAVENGVPLLRCCNNGVTCWIDARGVVRQVFRDANGSVHGAGVMTAQIPLLAPGEKREPTFYNRHGDWFGWGCIATVAVAMLARLTRTLRHKS